MLAEFVRLLRRVAAYTRGALHAAPVLLLGLAVGACTPLNSEVILTLGQLEVDPGEMNLTAATIGSAGITVRVAAHYTFTSEQKDPKANLTLAVKGGLPAGLALTPPTHNEPDLKRQAGGTVVFNLTLSVVNAIDFAAVAAGRYAVALEATLCATGVDDASTAGQKGDICEQQKAQLTIVVLAAPGTVTNLMLNPGFEQIVAAGDLPSLAGIWQGDATNTVPAEGAIAPHGGVRMLKFIATGPQASATLVSSQMWQIVDLRAWSSAIDAGGVRVDASAWFNRVTGGPNTDRRFDLRVLAFDTTDAGVPMRYQANAALAVGATSVDSTGAAWQQARTQLMLPPQTRVVLVEIYAYEDVLNDAVAPEFDGHYADDVVLTLTLP